MILIAFSSSVPRHLQKAEKRKIFQPWSRITKQNFLAELKTLDGSSDIVYNHFFHNICGAKHGRGMWVCRLTING